MNDTGALREQAVAAMRRLDALGMNRGSTGNLSLRCGAGMLITPTGMAADELEPDDMVWLGWDGTLQGKWQASSEWPFHRAVYAKRGELQAIVHTHSVHATALACLRRELPSFHDMVAVAGGASVSCVPYHLFGSEALSQAVAEAMRERDACLLANHGQIALADTPASALELAAEVEILAEQYWKVLCLGHPIVIPDAEMTVVLEKFRTYGQTARK